MYHNSVIFLPELFLSLNLWFSFQNCFSLRTWKPENLYSLLTLKTIERGFEGHFVLFVVKKVKSLISFLNQPN
jgi:hypothetical protein